MLPCSDIARLLACFESSLQCLLQTAQGYPYVTFTPQILSFLDPCGFGFFIYFRLFTHKTEHILLLCLLHICFNFLSFTFFQLKGEIFSKPFCLTGLSVPWESQDPWAQKVSASCSVDPSLGSPLDQRDHTQSEHNRAPCPRSPQLSVLLTAGSCWCL